MSPVMSLRRLSSGNGRAGAALSNSASWSIDPRPQPRSKSRIATRRPRNLHPPVMTMRMAGPPEFTPNSCATDCPSPQPSPPKRGEGVTDIAASAAFPLSVHGGRVRGCRIAVSADPVFPGPAEPGYRIAFRPVLAADPARIADLVEEVEEVGVMDFADIRLVAPGIAGDLDMRIVGAKRADPGGE